MVQFFAFECHLRCLGGIDAGCISVVVLEVREEVTVFVEVWVGELMS